MFACTFGLSILGSDMFLAVSGTWCDGPGVCSIFNRFRLFGVPIPSFAGRHQKTAR